MPTELPNGSLVFSPEETVVALLEQGHTPEEIIADAETAIAEAKAGVAWVTAIADEASAATDDRVRAQNVAQQAIADARRGGASADVLGEAERLLGDAALDVTIASMQSGDARVALTHFKGHANETIRLAEARIRAAQDPKITEPAVARYKESKQAEAAAAKKAEK